MSLDVGKAWAFGDIADAARLRTCDGDCLCSGPGDGEQGARLDAGRGKGCLRYAENEVVTRMAVTTCPAVRDLRVRLVRCRRPRSHCRKSRKAGQAEAAGRGSQHLGTYQRYSARASLSNVGKGVASFNIQLDLVQLAIDHGFILATLEPEHRNLGTDRRVVD